MQNQENGINGQQIKMKVKVNKGQKRKGIRIAIFNHKGGVGKTTLTVNIAAAL